jgi:hypothetical protein
MLALGDESELSDGDADGPTIDACGRCGGRLPLRRPNGTAPAYSWGCNRCGSVFLARCQEEDGRPKTDGVRLVPYAEVLRRITASVEGASPAVSTKDVKRLVRCLATHNFHGREARKAKRHAIAAPVTAFPLGADLRVVGAPTRTVTVNISSGGAAVVFPRKVVEPYLVLDFTASGVELLPVILKVNRVRTLTMAFEIGGEFLSRIVT